MQPVQEKRIHYIAFLLSDGMRGFTGDAVFPDTETARRAWPDYRRETWAHAHVGSIPRAAATFDGLMTAGHDVLWGSWQSRAYSVEAVLEALERDRAAVRAFETRDPKGARAVADYLALLMRAFDRVEAEAWRYAEKGPDRWHGGPPRLSSGKRYGDGPIRFND
jgi:hypothetical protein